MSGWHLAIEAGFVVVGLLSIMALVRSLRRKGL